MSVCDHKICLSVVRKDKTFLLRVKQIQHQSMANTARPMYRSEIRHRETPKYGEEALA